MKQLTTSDLWPLPVYEQVRDEFRKSVIAEKTAHRRIGVGPFMSFVFENRLTVKFTLMEILRAEKVTDPSHVAEELETFNTMLPPPGALSATLLVELRGTEDEVKHQLTRLTGLDQHVWLVVDGEKVKGELDANRDDGARISAVQYVRFKLGGLASKLASAGKVELVVDHPAYDHRVTLTAAQCRSLAADLEPS
ncbi:MAG: DUF3501 family protein [Deltaproteobacteria bacterium]|nr:DUF3501 family protein [Deltaproteobacteria bacterium]